MQGKTVAILESRKLGLRIALEPDPPKLGLLMTALDDAPSEPASGSS